MTTPFFSTAPASAPDVSVIIAVYNAMPYLTECLDSVLGQSIGLDRIEVIAVDDGSTDGSGAELDRYARAYPQLQVIHQPNTGGPSRPRNRALDLARGRFTFVVDADDYLGREALQRLVAMADAQDSDVVLPKLVGLGRAVADKAHKHAERADLYRSEVYRSLHSAKLMRREMLETHRIRYPEDLWFGEDQLFVTEAYLAARTISVVGDYDGYFLRRREDGGNITARSRTAAETVQHIERVMQLVSDRVTDPVGRRRMLGRHIRNLLGKAILPAVRSRAADPAFAWEVLDRSRALCATHFTDDMSKELSQLAWIQLYAFLHGNDLALDALAHHTPSGPAPIVIDNGRLYRAHPLFRDPRAGLPDELYDVTDSVRTPQRLQKLEWHEGKLRLSGYAYIDVLPTTGMTTEFVLRRRQTQTEVAVPVTVRATPALAAKAGSDGADHSMAGFDLDLDLNTAERGGPLTHGTWDCFLRLRAEGVERTVRFGRALGKTVDRTARRPVVFGSIEGTDLERTAVVYFTDKWNNISLEVQERRIFSAPPTPLPAARVEVRVPEQMGVQAPVFPSGSGGQAPVFPSGPGGVQAPVFPQQPGVQAPVFPQATPVWPQEPGGHWDR
ncbi:glycosyltransferase [Streptomyces purpureus]|uniref:Glycosyltransferase 2-like domain-containing protein n=1 Tax=Streptomyces purpureus TaxID=1951 RepID=A0A918LM92_9ACTN|nr:glycosyltransferase [Streptomyces purpureus]GGT18076.1 hypothetical protein GCM10014713_08610 [Streptomyces purpureus]